MKRESPSSADRSFIGSLAHGLAVLEAVADCERDISLGELAERVGFNKTSTWRLAHTLVDLGYLHQDPQSRSFRPGARTLALGYAYFDRLDLKQLSVPVLQELSARHNESVTLAVRNDEELIYLERLGSSHIIAVNLHVGSRLPLYCTSLGRALLSEMPESWLEQYLHHVIANPKLFDTEWKRLRQQLTATRKRGYAINDEELVKGLRAVACPIRDSTAKIMAGICISVPTSRASVSDLENIFAPDLLAAAERISFALGYRGEQPAKPQPSLPRKNGRAMRTAQ